MAHAHTATRSRRALPKLAAIGHALGAYLLAPALLSRNGGAAATLFASHLLHDAADSAHHARPPVPWYRLPALHRELYGDDETTRLPFANQLHA